MGKIKSFVLFCLGTITLAFILVYGPAVEQSAIAAGFSPKNQPSDERIWQILPSGPLVPEQDFSLFTSPSGFVAYGKRGYGINLVWAKRKQQHDYGAPANFRLSRAAGTPEPIKYGEAVAIRERAGGYIRYKKRDYGINLGFSPQPSYEWEVRGGEIGAPIKAGNEGDSPSNISDVVISLYNRTIKCYVVYGERQYGINLKWKGGSTCS